MNKEQIMKEVGKAKAHLERLGYNVAYIGIYGSQNYGLDVYTDEYKSDIDLKAVVVPTLEQLVHNSKPVSTTITWGDGQIDLKDIRVFTETLCKCNPAYIETLFTEYSIYTKDYKFIIDERDNIVAEMGAFLLKASFGMIKEKEKAFSHPYPSIKDKIEKYGYDPKQLHHIERLKNMMSEYVYEGKYTMTQYDKETRDWLMDIKVGKLPLEDAKHTMSLGIKIAKGLLEKYDVEPKFEAKERIVTYSRDLIYNNIIAEAKEESKKTVIRV